MDGLLKAFGLKGSISVVYTAMNYLKNKSKMVSFLKDGQNSKVVLKAIWGSITLYCSRL